MPTKTPVTVAFASILFTLAVWAWILTRPAGTFHDQGGLSLTMIYFPTTFGVWFVCGLSSIVLAIRARRSNPEGGSVIGLTAALVILGLLLSVGTLFLA
jgi:hypothetical protein